MEIYVELDEGIRYNRSTGKIMSDDRRRSEVELTINEMKIMNILIDLEWHKIEEIEEKTGMYRDNIAVTMTRIRKKAKKYIRIENKYRKGEYRCERIKKE